MATNVLEHIDADDCLKGSGFEGSRFRHGLYEASLAAGMVTVHSKACAQEPLRITIQPDDRSAGLRHGHRGPSVTTSDVKDRLSLQRDKRREIFDDLLSARNRT